MENAPSDPLPPSASPWRVVGRYVLWMLVLLPVLAIAALQFRARDAVREPLQRIDTVLQARYVVGLHRLRPQEMTGQGAHLLDELAPAGATFDQRLAAAVVAGEIDSAAAARDRLAALSAPADAQAAADLVTLRTWYAGEPVAADARGGLIARRGWIARLALIHGLPDADPERRRILATAVRAAATLVVFFLLALGGLMAGLALAGVAWWLWRSGRLRPAPVADSTGDGLPTLAAFAAYLWLFIAFSACLSALHLGTAATWGFLALVPVPLVILRGFGWRWDTICGALGWHRGRGVGREVAAGLLGYLAGLPLIAVGFLITNLLSRVLPAGHPFTSEVAHAGPLRLLALAALACGFAPLVEETFFRGALLHHLRVRLPAWPAAAICGLIFAAIHPQGLAGLPVLAAIGTVLALVRLWRGSLIASMTAHALNNGVALALTLLLLG